MRIPNLREYVLGSDDTPRIEVFRRPERGHWIRQEARAGGTIAIAGRMIRVDDIFRRGPARRSRCRRAARAFAAICNLERSWYPDNRGDPRGTRPPLRRSNPRPT